MVEPAWKKQRTSSSSWEQDPAIRPWHHESATQDEEALTPNDENDLDNWGQRGSRDEQDQAAEGDSQEGHQPNSAAHSCDDNAEVAPVNDLAEEEVADPLADPVTDFYHARPGRSAHAEEVDHEAGHNGDDNNAGTNRLGSSLSLLDDNDNYVVDRDDNNVVDEQCC